MKSTWNTKTNKSIFFEIADKIDHLINHQKTQQKTTDFTMAVHNIYQPTLPPKINVRVLETNLMGDSDPVVSIISTPEAEIISGAGGFTKGKNEELSFTIPRFHLGIPAQLDMEVAMYQLANSPLMKKIIQGCTHSNSGVIYFAREGHLTQWQKAMHLVNKENIPTTIVSISHKPSDNVFTRESFLATPPNLEGFNLKNLDYLFLCDPVASGMQHIAMIEELAKLNALPKTVVAIGPMSTRYGLTAIALACERLGIGFAAGACATLLDSNPPLRYYSPYPNKNIHVANKNLHKFIKEHFNDVLAKSCIRCNWTGTFFGGPEMPMQASESELADVGLSNKTLLDLIEKIDEAKAKEYEVFESLVPYSTRLEG